MELILASQSPRRKELMELMGLHFSVVVSGEKEIVPPDANASDTVKALSYQKASHVFKENPLACVVGADTVVEIDGQILGKPHNAETAFQYLQKLQGRTHTVYTGLTVLSPGMEQTACCRTDVTFKPMTSDEINWYVTTGDPLDKAGAYGVQGLACHFVEKLNGNYFNVIGLPIPLLYNMLLNARYMDVNHRIL